MRIAGQQSVNGYTEEPREGMGFHTTCIHQAKTVGNLSILHYQSNWITIWQFKWI